MVRSPDHEDGDAILVFDRVENGAPLLLHVVLEDGERLPRFAAGVIVLVFRDPEARAEDFEHPAREEHGLHHRHRGVEVLDAACGEEIDLLGEGRLHDVGRPATMGQLALSIVSDTNEFTWVRMGKKM